MSRRYNLGYRFPGRPVGFSGFGATGSLAKLNAIVQIYETLNKRGLVWDRSKLILDKDWSGLSQDHKVTLQGDWRSIKGHLDEPTINRGVRSVVVPRRQNDYQIDGPKHNR